MLAARTVAACRVDRRSRSKRRHTACRTWHSLRWMCRSSGRRVPGAVRSSGRSARPMDSRMSNYGISLCSHASVVLPFISVSKNVTVPIGRPTISILLNVDRNSMFYYRAIQLICIPPNLVNHEIARISPKTRVGPSTALRMRPHPCFRGFFHGLLS
jgi:hypothetical protein